MFIVSVSRRREQVLDAALAVLGVEGSRGLTYMAVDQAAGAPVGSASNYFHNRAALLRGALTHLLALDHQDWERVARRPPRDIDELTEALANLVRHCVGAGSTRTRARYALFLEAMTRPELADLLTDGRAEILSWGTELLTHLGLDAPAQRYRQLAAHLDGCVLHQLAFPEEAIDPAPGFRAILTG